MIGVIFPHLERVYIILLRLRGRPAPSGLMEFTFPTWDEWLQTNPESTPEQHANEVKRLFNLAAEERGKKAPLSTR